MAGEDVQVSRLLDERGLERVSDPGADLVGPDRADRRLRHRRDRLCGAAPDQGLARASRRASTWVLTASILGVLFGSQIVRLGRRPLRPQDRADLAAICFSEFSPSPPPIRPISPNCSGCARSPVSASAASSRMWSRSTPNRRRAICARRWRSLPPAACRSAARCRASSAPVSCRQYGWPILFYVGGMVPIVVGLAALFGLPESIKYMALHESQRPRDVKADRGDHVPT